MLASPPPVQISTRENGSGKSHKCAGIPRTREEFDWDPKDTSQSRHRQSRRDVITICKRLRRVGSCGGWKLIEPHPRRRAVATCALQSRRTYEGCCFLSNHTDDVGMRDAVSCRTTPTSLDCVYLRATPCALGCGWLNRVAPHPRRTAAYTLALHPVRWAA